MRWSVSVTASTLAALLLLCTALSLATGAVSVPVGDALWSAFNSLSSADDSRLAPFQQVVVMELRLPRLLLAIAVGAILAQCGAVMQGLFRNPLADPGIIGVSSGAALGAIIAIVLLPKAMGEWAIPVSAFVGGLATTLLVYQLAHSKNGTSVLVLLLAGVAVSAFAGAAIGSLSYFASDSSLRELSVWQMGSLASASNQNLWLAFITLAVLSLFFYRRAVALDALLLGEAEARHLGVQVEKLKLQMIVLTAIGVGVAVACSGIIGFVGLVVPHLVRLATGPSHQSLLPLSALLGALLLAGSDLAARTLVQPAELPVGLVTALLGAPFFLILLLQQRKDWSQ
jgi:iron complex transport system permease protein